LSALDDADAADVVQPLAVFLAQLGVERVGLGQLAQGAARAEGHRQGVGGDLHHQPRRVQAQDGGREPAQDLGAGAQRPEGRSGAVQQLLAGGLGIGQVGALGALDVAAAQRVRAGALVAAQDAADRVAELAVQAVHAVVQR
jgi:hypothetical protein